MTQGEEGDMGRIPVPALAAFVGAKRMQLLALVRSTVTESLRNGMGDVTRVASLRPQTLGQPQALARLRALPWPSAPEWPAERQEVRSSLIRIQVSGAPGGGGWESAGDADGVNVAH
jgi:hypothetical protein